MGLTIKNNLMAENAARHLGRSYGALATSVERLSSGLRINSSKDDAAGLAVRELIRADVAMFKQASRNAQDGISMLQTAEGAMAAMDEILIRMKELAEQASTDGYSTDQRTIMSEEFAELSLEIDRIATSTKFNSIAVLNSTTALDIHLGEGKITVSPEKMTAAELGIDSTTGAKERHGNFAVTVAEADNAYAAIDVAGSKDAFDFTFTNETVFTIDLSAWDAGNISLNELVDAINTQVAVQHADNGYAAAFAVYDPIFMRYHLEIEAEEALTANNAVVINGNLPDALVAGNFTEVTDGTDGGGLNLDSSATAQAALVSVGLAIVEKDSYRAKLGYWMNRLEAASTVLDIQAENLLAAESRISDVDVATEMAAMTRNQVLAQAGIAMLGQANQMPQLALRLLQ